MHDLIWKPTAAQKRKSHISAFMRRHGISDLDELLLKTTTGIEWFWDACNQETQIQWQEPYLNVLDPQSQLEKARWFVGGRLNIAQNCVSKHLAKKASAQRMAVLWQGECGAQVELTYQDLEQQSQSVAQLLVKDGLKPGDVVAFCMPWLPETVPAWMGVLRAGGVVAPLSWQSSPEAIASRLSLLQAPFVFTCDGTQKGGESLSVYDSLQPALKKSKATRRVYVVRRLFQDLKFAKKDRDRFFEMESEQPLDSTLCQEMPAEAPAFILYPQNLDRFYGGAVQTHAGALIQAAKEFWFHLDFKAKDRIFWPCDAASTRGVWQTLGTLHFGGSLILAEGDLFHPKASRFLKMIENQRVTHVGLENQWAQKLKSRFDKKALRVSLTSVRIFGFNPEAGTESLWAWCFRKLGKQKIPFLPFLEDPSVFGSPWASLAVSDLDLDSFQGPGLGMSVDLVNRRRLKARAGERGFLTFQKPCPSMTKRFWSDEKLYETYHAQPLRPAWRQGHWGYRDEAGRYYSLGRILDLVHLGDRLWSPREIEGLAESFAFVDQAHFIGDNRKKTYQLEVTLESSWGKTWFLETHLKQWFEETVAPLTDGFEIIIN